MYGSIGHSSGQQYAAAMKYYGKRLRPNTIERQLGLVDALVRAWPGTRQWRNMPPRAVAVLALAAAFVFPAIGTSQAIVPISGIAVDNRGTGIIGIPVTANQEGQPDSTNTNPTYLLFNDTSSVPEIPQQPQIQESSWGKLKINYTQPNTTIIQVRKLLPENILRFNGGTTHFTIEHQLGEPLEGNYTFNVMIVPINYSTPTIGPTEINVEAVKRFYQVGIYGDNLFWAHDREHTYPMPILLRQNITQAKIDSLQSRIDLHTAILGRELFIIGHAVYGEYGIVWDTESFQNSTTYNTVPGTLEIRSARIQTRPGDLGYDVFRIALHEMARALGISGNVHSTEYGGEYGHLYYDFSSPSIKAWAVLDIGLSKQEQTHQGNNNATMQEWR